MPSVAGSDFLCIRRWRKCSCQNQSCFQALRNKRHRLQDLHDTSVLRKKTGIYDRRTALSPWQTVIERPLIEQRVVAHDDGPARTKTKTAADCRCRRYDGGEVPRRFHFNQSRQPGQRTSKRTRDIVLECNVGWYVLVHVIYNFLFPKAHEDAKRYELGIMKVVQVGILAKRLTPNGPSYAQHAREPV